MDWRELVCWLGAILGVALVLAVLHIAWYASRFGIF